MRRRRPAEHYTIDSPTRRHLWAAGAVIVLSFTVFGSDPHDRVLRDRPAPVTTAEAPRPPATFVAPTSQSIKKKHRLALEVASL